MAERLLAVKETKIFDPRDGYAPFVDPAVVTDATVAKRGNRWWMYVAGRVLQREGIQLFSASLPEGAPLSAKGWKLTADPKSPKRVAMLAPQKASRKWDLKGGRHCPCYARGWDPGRQAWVERIYYAGGAEYVWGPYTIGYLEWDGERWVEQPEPVFTATEVWERGSVFEPNVIYAEGAWKIWYVAGSTQEDYIVHGFSESEDGKSGWSPHKMVFRPEFKVFDFNVCRSELGYEAVFSRVWTAHTPPPEETGLWWCHSRTAAADMANWSTPVQIMTAERREWHAGPWKPSLQYGEDPRHMFVFFAGLPPAAEWAHAFTLGCLEVERPE